MPRQVEVINLGYDQDTKKLVTMPIIKEKLTITNYSANAQVNASGGSVQYIVFASAGYITEVDAIGFSVGPPGGTTSGTHRIRAAVATDDTADRIFDYTVAHNAAIVVQAGVLQGAGSTEYPGDKATQAIVSKGFRITPTVGLILTYVNSTDVNTTQSRIYKARLFERTLIS